MTEQNLDKIEAYLRGKLTVEARAAFEREIDRDPELAREVELVRLELQAGYILIEDNLRKKMEAWNPPRNRRGPWSWIIAIAGLVAAGLVFMWILQPDPPSPGTQTAPQTSESTEVTSTEEPRNEPFVEPNAATDAQPPSREAPSQSLPAAPPAAEADPMVRLARSLFAEISPSIDDDAGDQQQKALESRGKVLFQSGNYTAAKTVFDSLRQHRNPRYRYPGQGLYLLSMLALKEQQSADFNRLLDEIAGALTHPARPLAIRMAVELTVLRNRIAADQGPVAAALYEQFDGPASLRNVLRGPGDSDERPLRNALTELERDSFQQALAIAQSRMSIPEEATTAQNIAAHAYFGLREYRSATDLFASLTQTEAPDIRQPAEWFLLLSQYALGRQNEEAFGNLLRRVANDAKHPYREQAQALLTSIERSY